MRAPIRTAAFAAALVILAACGGADSASFTRVSANEFSVAMASGDGVVVDIRTPEEVATGAIAGATFLDFYAPDFSARLADLDRDTHYLVYCRTSSRSGTMVRMMKDLGFRNVTELDGGIEAWVSSGFPTVVP